MASAKKTGLGKGLDALFNSPFIADVIDDESINIDAKKNGDANIKYIKLNNNLIRLELYYSSLYFYIKGTIRL